MVAATAAAQPDSRGPEFQVNTYTPDSQFQPRVASLGPTFSVVWSSYYQDGSEVGIFSRRYDAAGIALGGEFPVNLHTVESQLSPAIAASASGFVVAWQSYQQDGSAFGVFGRSFNAAGNAIGVEFQINTYTPGTQENPAVAMDSTGFVVVWQGGGANYAIFGRRWDAMGSPIGGSFLISTYPTSNQVNPDVALDGAGNFVVVWTGAQDGDQMGVFGRRFDAGGNPLAVEFQVNLHTTGGQLNPQVARSGSGFVVVWDANDQDDRGIFGRRFNSDGTPASGELQINTFYLSTQQRTTVEMATNGAFVVAWNSNQQDGYGTGVAARHFDSSGSPTSVDFVVNSFAEYSQDSPDVAIGGSRFVVVWESNLQDRSFEGVFAQRLRTADFTLDVDGNGSITPLTDTLLLLRYAFGFRGAVLINDAVGAGCTRCTAPAIEEYLAGEL
ncbi:MAG TPA: hypothetical protein VHR17_04465 [Thermoanaerobaculia bacterium]|nr:hypothetical protein [Thermoanaerobaculia bacterium]